MKILFLCVANMARSQMAEGIANTFNWGDNVEIQSAGSRPSGIVDKFAKAVLEEDGINTKGLYSKGLEDLDPDFLNSLDYVITLCAEEWCPTFKSPNTKKLHWPITDPVGKGLSDESRLAFFRKIKEEITTKIQEFYEKCHEL